MNSVLITLILVPILEIYLFIKIGGQIGAFNTISLIFITAIIGVFYARYEGLNTLRTGLNQLIKNESEKILKNELLLREKNKLPPFMRLIAIIISSKDRSLSLQGAREIKVKLSKLNNLEILGPVDSPLLKIKKNFRTRLLIRFNNQNIVQKKIANALNRLKISSKIKLTVDVDPINFA